MKRFDDHSTPMKDAAVARATYYHEQYEKHTHALDRVFSGMYPEYDPCPEYDRVYYLQVESMLQRDAYTALAIVYGADSRLFHWRIPGTS